MSHKREKIQARRGGRWTLFLGLAFFAALLTGCDEILDVELPGQITSEETFNPEQADVLVFSAIADIECAMSDFIAMNGAGNADAFHRTIGWLNGSMEYEPTPDTGSCANSENDYGWFTGMHEGRWLAEQTYQRLDEEWTVDQVPNRDDLMALAAIYIGHTMGMFGEYLCEAAVNAGPLLSWEEALEGNPAKGTIGAEGWYTAALGHIADAGGDFEIPNGITTSAEQLAYLLRARSKLARGDYAGAAADAQQVTQGFIAYITRESGSDQRRNNRVYTNHNQTGYSTLVGVITHEFWQADDVTNPVTQQPWPDPIPYTGYWNLAILPDGRAVSDAGYPITTDEPGAEADSRVPAMDTGNTEDVRGYPIWRQMKYTSPADDYPLAKWEEAWLIRAEVAARGATAEDPVDLVNDIRAAHDLPEIDGVSYNPTTEDELLNMIVEENRRTHFLEGRFWSTKLRHDLWFPRGQGRAVQHNYQGGVRMVLPGGEYEINENFDQSDQGTYCPPNQTPVGI
ncbi:MAG: hypothetical protein ACLFWG_03645 [Longimicrobiales bacterium]